jgi:hypothetical protein
MRVLLLTGTLLAAIAAPIQSQSIPPLPDESGWGVHVLAIARDPDGAVWVGTYGRGIFVLRPGAAQWEHIADDDSEGSISWGFVHAFEFGTRGEVWYGTLGNGWGYSTDGGTTWRNWTFRMLGPEYQYVAPNGIVSRGDTVYVATADGMKLSWDMGDTWHEITDSIGTRTAGSVWGVIGNQYVLAIGAAPDGTLWVSHVHGIERSDDGGRNWREIPRAVWDRVPAPVPAGYEGAPQPCRRPNRVRAFAFDEQLPGLVWLGTEYGALHLQPDEQPMEMANLIARPAVQQLALHAEHRVVAATAAGLWTPHTGTPPEEEALRLPLPTTAVLPLDDGGLLVGTPRGLAVTTDWTVVPRPEPVVAPLEGWPSEPKHTWFVRPASLDEQPYMDQTYRYGSTMGGNFQQHQGVEFNAGAGTPLFAIGDGVVAFAADAEAGSRTVVIRHDRTLEAGDAEYFLYSAYFHNSEVLVEEGQPVTAGDVISLVGNTGRATNDHLHLEVHATPVDDLHEVVDPEQRYPPHSTNPELWIAPLPGAGIVAGRVWNADGEPVLQARIYGLHKGEPQETPFSFVETYGDRTRGTPAYGEHFAIGDVPAGEYVLGVEVDGRQVYRRVRVAPGRLTWVEFRP